jgi:hypothetical protein
MELTVTFYKNQLWQSADIKLVLANENDFDKAIAEIKLLKQHYIGFKSSGVDFDSTNTTAPSE